MLRFVLHFALFCALSCSKEQPPTAPAGKAVDFGSMFDSFNDQQKEEGDETAEEETETDSTSSEGGPDLIVQSPSVSDSMLTPGQMFTLNVTVHNQGDEQAAATMLHYYRSNNATITSSDTEVGTGEIGALDTSATSAASIALTAPTSVSPQVGIYYGACVASVSGESSTDNNCSSAVKITVSGQETSEEKEDEATQDGTDGDIASGDDEADEDTTSDASLSAEVFIPDTVLRTFIEKELKKSPGETITQAEMNTIESLVGGPDLGIENLRGLEAAKNLQYLFLADNQISDLTPLANLDELKELSVAEKFGFRFDTVGQPNPIAILISY